MINSEVLPLTVSIHDLVFQVQDVLSNITDQTVLVIAHRLETVAKADHIIFMEGGEVVEQGTHKQLMANEGRYYRLKEKLFNLETQPVD